MGKKKLIAVTSCDDGQETEGRTTEQNRPPGEGEDQTEHGGSRPSRHVEYEGMLRKRTSRANQEEQRKKEDEQYRSFEESMGVKKRHKMKKGKSGGSQSYLKWDRRLAKSEIYTRPLDELIEGPGSQLELEDKFSENIYHRISRDLTNWAKHQSTTPSSLLNNSTMTPELKIMNMLTELHDIWTQISSKMNKSREEISRFNLRLGDYIKKTKEGAKGRDQIDHKETKEENSSTKEQTEQDGALRPQEVESIEAPGVTQCLDRTLTKHRLIEQELKDFPSYVNCDVRSFNFESITKQLGSFDVLLVDPPWRIKGGQKNDSQFMFSNSTFSLDYNTMSNSEIMNLPLEKLSDKGFIFLWILANQVDCCVDILGKWGYQLVDIIVWVKVKDKKIWLSHGYYFMHSYELCLVGYKCPIKEHVEFYSKVSNNLIFAEFRGKSQKPDELYEIIETMMPGSKKIEIFARNNNVRPGWLALGNQLGPQFAKWENTVTCNNCQRSLDFSSKRRYKSKKTANYDLCEKCLTEEKLSTQDFFVLNTMIKEDILHEYHACNMCGVEPIWGVRFKNEDVADFDLCEACFDRDLETKGEQSVVVKNRFRAIEVPELAAGFQTHSKKCSNCSQCPIVGVCFECSECKGLYLCQYCFFSEKPLSLPSKKHHVPEHAFELHVHSTEEAKENYQCSWCEHSFSSVYKCNNCHKIYFCEACYAKRDHWTPKKPSQSHKKFHNDFTKL